MCRVNISNANIFGLSTELDLVRNNRYNVALVIFFVPYILGEIPSNIILKKLRPHVWLSGCMFAFGLVTTLQGLVQNYSGLLATRFFLGLFEAGMFPGCKYEERLNCIECANLFQASTFWACGKADYSGTVTLQLLTHPSRYRRHEAQRRFSFFFSSTTLAGAFGGLLASAIGKMDYMRGYRGWRWYAASPHCLRETH